MIWNRLKNMKCPKCGNDISEVSNGKQIGYGCQTKGYECTFFVGKEKFNQIIDNMYKNSKPIFKSEEENLSELNNWTDRPEYDEDGNPNE